MAKTSMANMASSGARAAPAACVTVVDSLGHEHLVSLGEAGRHVARPVVGFPEPLPGGQTRAYGQSERGVPAPRQ